MMPRVILSALVVAIAASWGCPATAGGVSAQVALEGCGSLDAAEIARLVELEINSGRETIGDAPVVVDIAVVCLPGGTRIMTFDPLTQKRSERTMNIADPAGPEPVRVVALAASQLLRASWLELVAPLLPERGEGKPAAPAADREAPRRALVAVDLGARARDLGNAMLAGRAAFTAGGAKDMGWNLRGTLAFEYGSSSRGIGTASIYAAWIALGMSRGFVLLESVRMEIGAGLGGGFVLMSGDGTRPEIIEHDVRGFTGEVTAHLGPVLPVGESVRLALLIEGGYGLRTPVGRIDGDREITTGGLFAGLVLRLGFSIR
jgi:hypothetical protein